MKKWNGVVITKLGLFIVWCFALNLDSKGEVPEVKPDSSEIVSAPVPIYPDGPILGIVDLELLEEGPSIVGLKLVKRRDGKAVEFTELISDFTKFGHFRIVTSKLLVSSPNYSCWRLELRTRLSRGTELGDTVLEAAHLSVVDAHYKETVFVDVLFRETEFDSQSSGNKP